MLIPERWAAAVLDFDLVRRREHAVRVASERVGELHKSQVFRSPVAAEQLGVVLCLFEAVYLI